MIRYGRFRANQTATVFQAGRRQSMRSPIPANAGSACGARGAPEYAPHMPTAPRIRWLDLLRGMVIVLMALDHTRDFFQPAGIDPTDIETTTPVLYLTRWVTHLCAPTFVFLAGVGMGAQLSREGATPALLRFFATRGLWLMVLEATWVNWSWFFSASQTHLGVLWGIGGAMVVLTPFCRWSPRWVGLIGAASTLALAILPVPRAHLGSLLFFPDTIMVGEHPVYSVYVILPWAAVLAMGIGAGQVLLGPSGTQWARRASLAALVLFVVLRGLQFGDPQPWLDEFGTSSQAFMSFMNVSKYPPSLDFLLVTLGVSFLIGSTMGSWPQRLQRALEIPGRVPLFFYLLHLPTLHMAGWIHATLRYDAASIPKTAALELSTIYIAWAGMTFLLWWPCKWYETYKTQHPAPWMRYL